MTVLAASTPASAADTLPVPDHGLTVSASTQAASIHYGVHLDRWQLSGGLRYAPGPRGVELPMRTEMEVVTVGRYRLLPSVEIAPSILVRDDVTPAVRSRVGLDNRWIGERLGASIGVDVDAATTLSDPFDRRLTPALAAGVVHRFDRFDTWLTGRSGYTFAGADGGTVTWEIGLGIVVSL